jgi:DNA polymerase-1
VLAVDTETRSLRWFEPEQAFLATWADAGAECAAPLVQHPNVAAKGAEEQVFLSALANEDALIFHNAKFDAHMMRENLGYCVYENGHTVHDTAIMSRVVYGRQRSNHGLEGLSKDLLPDGGKASTKASISDIYRQLSGRSQMSWDDAFWDVWVEDPEALEAYAMADVRDTYDLFNVLWPQIEADPRLQRIYNLEMDVLRVLYDAERRGVLVDPDAVARLQAHHAARETQAATVLALTLGFLPEGEGSDEQLRQRLPELGVELTERTPLTGELAVNARALEKFADHPAVAALLEWRNARKFQTTYLSAFEGRSVVQPDFQSYEAWTGRMSCRRPNLQNLPKRTDTDPDENNRIRSVFVPRPGMEFIVADFDQIEPRLLAYYLGSPEYRQIVAEGRTYEQACMAAWGGAESDYVKGGPRGKLRDAGKVIYLGIAYGAGGPAVRNGINRFAPPEYHVDVGWVKDPDNKYDTPPQANAIKKKIIASIPGFEGLASSNRRRPGSIYRQLQKDGYVRTLFGRKQWVPLEKAYVGLNALIQGSAADVMKQAAVNVAAALEPHGGYPLLFVHDEVVCEVPAGKGEELMEVVVEAMETAAFIDPPLTVDASVTGVSYAHA